MLFSRALLLSVLAGSATASVQSLVRQSRRLEDVNQEEAEMTEFGHLMNYQVKFLSCQTGLTWLNEQGNYEANAIVYRLCPVDDCDCKDGYGDYVVGLNTYTQAYYEAIREEQNQNGNNNNNNNGFKEEEYAECKQYQQRNNRALAENQNANAYYVGPTCSADGSSVSYALFSEYTCTTGVEDVAFEDISNGYSLPANFFSSASCTSCLSTDENGGSEPSDFCMDIYQWAGKCESKMQYSGLYGKDETQCDLVEAMVPKAASKGKAGKVFLVFLAIAIVGAAGLFMYQKKKKSVKGTVSSEGLMS